MPGIEGQGNRDRARPGAPSVGPRPSGRKVTNTGAGYVSPSQSNWLKQLESMLFAQQGGGGGQPRQYVGGGGGGGGGYDPFAFERQRLAELDKRKKMLTGQLQGAKRAALPLISKYSHDYGVNVGKLFKQNQGMNAEYTKQLRSLGNQMTGGAMTELAGLRRDLGAQGAGGADMAALQGAAQQNIAGQQFLTNNADSFNRRLGQVSQNAATDAKAMGAAIGTSGKTSLENSYLQALMQIQMMGLV